MTARGRLMDRIPAAVSLRIRADRNVRRLFGLDGPASLVMRLVPPGRNAVDAGANRGIYTFWMHTKAPRVDAFEPQAFLAGYLRAARLRGVRVHELALSDRAGRARLIVPDDDEGLARLSPKTLDDNGSGAPGLELGPSHELDVDTQALDFFGLRDVGFLKVDVEGHELAVLRGAEETIERSRPVVFVESEARHVAGAPYDVIDLMLGKYGYRRGAFVRRWDTVDLDQFQLERDQLDLLPNFMHEAYVSNFLFWP